MTITVAKHDNSNSKIFTHMQQNYILLNTQTSTKYTVHDKKYGNSTKSSCSLINHIYRTCNIGE